MDKQTIETYKETVNNKHVTISGMELKHINVNGPQRLIKLIKNYKIVTFKS